MTKLKTLSSETIHSNPWFDYKHDKYQLSGGQEADYYYAETLGNAMAVPVLDDGRVALVAQYRYLGDRISVEFPCGSINKGETAIEAAQRELLEETGYASANMINVGVFEGLNGLARDTSHLFVALELSLVQRQKLDATEVLEIVYRRPDELDDMIQRGEIWDGQTLAAWALVRKKVSERI